MKQTAEKNDVSPQEWADKTVVRFEEAWRLLDMPDAAITDYTQAMNLLEVDVDLYRARAEVFREIMTEDAADESSKHDVGGDIIPKLVTQGRAHVYDYTTNVVPGVVGREEHYWRDVGTLDSYYDAHMDLVARMPVFNLYNDEWPIFTRTLTEPPAKIGDGDSGPSEPVADQGDPRTRFSNLVDVLGVAGSVEDHHGDFVDFLANGLAHLFEVVANGRIDVDRARCLFTNGDLVHVHQTSRGVHRPARRQGNHR